MIVCCLRRFCWVSECNKRSQLRLGTHFFLHVYLTHSHLFFDFELNVYESTLMTFEWSQQTQARSCEFVSKKKHEWKLAHYISNLSFLKQQQISRYSFGNVPITILWFARNYQMTRRLNRRNKKLFSFHFIHFRYLLLCCHLLVRHSNSIRFEIASARSTRNVQWARATAVVVRRDAKKERERFEE